MHPQGHHTPELKYAIRRDAWKQGYATEAARAVLRYAVPEANAGLYFGMALVITFPFNIVVGLPLYFAVLAALWR